MLGLCFRLPIAFDLLVLKQRWKSFLNWCVVSLILFLVSPCNNAETEWIGFTIGFTIEGTSSVNKITHNCWVIQLKASGSLQITDAFFQVPLVVVDSYYYGKLVVAPLNIVLYNVFTSHGPDLYGEFKIICGRWWFPCCCQGTVTHQVFMADLFLMHSETSCKLWRVAIPALLPQDVSLELEFDKAPSNISSWFSVLWVKQPLFTLKPYRPSWDVSTTQYHSKVVLISNLSGCNTSVVGTSGVWMCVFVSFNPVLGYRCSSRSGCRTLGG